MVFVHHQQLFVSDSQDDQCDEGLAAQADSYVGMDLDRPRIDFVWLASGPGDAYRAILPCPDVAIIARGGSRR